MKRILLPACALLFALAMTVPTAADTLTILHMGDSHSHLAPGGSRDASLRGTIGGIARLASALGAAEAEGGNVLTLHSGDVFIGDLFFNRYFGIPELRLLSALGIDAMALGNHELDLTPAVLSTALDSGFDAGGFPLLSANLIFPDTGFATLRTQILPYTIKDFGDLRVGIFGLTTPSTNLLSQPLPLHFEDQIYQTAEVMTDSLRARDCDVVILLSHLGIVADAAVAASVSGIDVIVGGHDHYLFEAPIPVPNPSGGTTLLVQAGPFYENIGRMRLDIGEAGVTMLDYAIVPLAQSVPEAPQVRALVDGMIADIESVYGPFFTQQIGYNAETLEEQVDRPMELGFKDTPLGNLVTDAYREATGMQIAIHPSGSIAERLWAGPLVFDDVFRAVGYGFNTDNGLGYRLVTLKLPGASLLAALEFGLSQNDIGDDYILQVSGMSYQYNPTADIGSRLVDARVAGIRVSPDSTYTVAANEFSLAILRTLGLPFSDEIVLIGQTEAQVLAAYVGGVDTLRARQEGRVEAVIPVGIAADAAAARSVSIECVPNPVASDAMLRIRLSSSTPVQLTLHDALGRTVRTLVDAPMSAGAHSVRLDASDLPVGAYLCRIVAGGATQTVVVQVR